MDLRHAGTVDRSLVFTGDAEEHEIYLPSYIYLHLPMEVISSCFFNWMICRACFIRHGNTCTCNLIILCLNY